MLSLYNSQKFQSELKSFKERSSKITDLKLKSNIENQVSKLEAKVKYMDAQFEEMIYTKQISSSKDEKSAIADLRKYIDSKLTDYEKSVSKSKQSL